MLCRVSTSRASLGSIGRWSEEHLHTSKLCLIDYKPSQLAESPLVEPAVLGFPTLGPFPYPLKGLKDDSSSSSKSLVSQLLPTVSAACPSRFRAVPRLLEAGTEDIRPADIGGAHLHLGPLKGVRARPSGTDSLHGVTEQYQYTTILYENQEERRWKAHSSAC